VRPILKRSLREAPTVALVGIPRVDASSCAIAPHSRVDGEVPLCALLLHALFTPHTANSTQQQIGCVRLIDSQNQ
jgi:hypothetical protein